VAAPICRDVLIEVQRRDPARRRQPESVAQGAPETPAMPPAPAPAGSLAARGPDRG
jgi:hypothetical protein